jgi:sec-independent protein translocase protein TatC
VTAPQKQRRKRQKYSSKSNPQGKMRLADHLIEFRNRFIICALAIIVAMIGGFLLTDFAFDVLRRPIDVLNEQRDGGVSINFGNVTTAFDLRLQVALTLGVVIASPVWLYQAWMFMMPGLRKGERRYVLGIFIMPRIIEMMATFVPIEDTIWYDAKTYYSFVLTLCLAVGIAFVVPVLLVMLNFAGILEGMSILKAWRYAVLICALFGAIATPAADVLSMFLLMVPMIVLYFLAVGIAVLNDRRRRKRDEKEAAATLNA